MTYKYSTYGKGIAMQSMKLLQLVGVKLARLQLGFKLAHILEHLWLWRGSVGASPDYS